MSNPSGLRYAPTHEWAKLDGDVVTVGITAFAVEQLTEPTYLELKPVGYKRELRQIRDDVPRDAYANLRT